MQIIRNMEQVMRHKGAMEAKLKLAKINEQYPE